MTRCTLQVGRKSRRYIAQLTFSRILKGPALQGESFQSSWPSRQQPLCRQRYTMLLTLKVTSVQPQLYLSFCCSLAQLICSIALRQSSCLTTSSASRETFLTALAPRMSKIDQDLKPCTTLFRLFLILAIRVLFKLCYSIGRIYSYLMLESLAISIQIAISTIQFVLFNCLLVQGQQAVNISSLTLRRLKISLQRAAVNLTSLLLMISIGSPQSIVYYALSQILAQLATVIVE